MEYREFGSELIDSVTTIYKRAGWTAYLSDDDKLRHAFDSSLYVLGCFDDERLVGFVRCTGDGEHELVIADLILDEAYQTQGAGKRLMNAVLEKYSGVRRVSLMTDLNNERANRFYQKMGFSTLEERGLVGYILQR